MIPAPGLLGGIALAVAATACFASLDSGTKLVGASLPLITALWIRYLVQAVLVSAVLLPARGLAAFRTAHPRFQLLRGLLLLSTSGLAYASLLFMPVGEFTAVVMLTPLAVTVLVAVVLRQPVSLPRWLLVAGGFAGALLVIRPGGAAFQWATLLPLALVACNAWFQVLTSRLAGTEDPLTMQLYSAWIGTIAVAAGLPWAWAPPADVRTWAVLGGMGFFAVLGHYLLTLAYRRAPVATLMPYMYGQIGFAMLGGLWLFGHVPDGMALAGIGLIALCGAAGAWLTVRESRIDPQPLEP